MILCADYFGLSLHVLYCLTGLNVVAVVVPVIVLVLLVPLLVATFLYRKR